MNLNLQENSFQPNCDSLLQALAWHPVIMPNPNHFTMGQLTLTGSPVTLLEVTSHMGWQSLSNQTYKLVNKVAFYGGLEKRFLFLFFLLPDAKLLIL